MNISGQFPYLIKKVYKFHNFIYNKVYKLQTVFPKKTASKTEIGHKERKNRGVRI